MMDYLVWPLAIVGGTVCVYVAVVALTILVASWKSVQDLNDEEILLRIGKDYMRQRLLANSRWFEEDAPTRNLLHGLAEDGDAIMLRNEWRQARRGLTLSAMEAGRVEPVEDKP